MAIGAFLFLDPDTPQVGGGPGSGSEENPGFLRAIGLRHLVIREETDYGCASDLASHTFAFNTFASRASSRTVVPGALPVSAYTRNLQFTTPLLIDGRYATSVGDGLGEVIMQGEAQRRLFDTLFARRGSSLSTSDLKSWNMDHRGPNQRESRIELGAKCSGFTISSTASIRGGVSPITLQAQYKTAGCQASTNEPHAWEHTLYPRHPGKQLTLQTSTIRISTGDVESDMLGTIVSDPTQVNVRCRRAVSKVTAGGVALGGTVRPLEPRLLSEAWQVRVKAPAWNPSEHAVAQSLVDASRSGQVVPTRYNIRVDYGAVSQALYVALPEVASAALHDDIWGPGGYSEGSPGESGARTYAVYARDTAGGMNQYVPTTGDMIRFQSDNGQSAVNRIIDGAGGGYVARIGDGRLAQGTQSAWGTPPSFPEQSDLVNNAGTADLWVRDAAGDQIRPQGHVSFWLSPGDRIHGNAETFERFVPGGLSITLTNMVLTGSDGLDNSSSDHQFVFASDNHTQAIVQY